MVIYLGQLQQLIWLNLPPARLLLSAPFKVSWGQFVTFFGVRKNNFSAVESNRLPIAGSCVFSLLSQGIAAAARFNPHSVAKTDLIAAWEKRLTVLNYII